LLEAISRVPFPGKDNLCTRFVMEVILRRASDSEVGVSLVLPNLQRRHILNPTTQVPQKCRSSVDQDRLWQFLHEFFTLEDSVTIVE
jgi:hypothetical protein